MSGGQAIAFAAEIREQPALRDERERLVGSRARESELARVWRTPLKLKHRKLRSCRKLFTHHGNEALLVLSSEQTADACPTWRLGCLLHYCSQCLRRHGLGEPARGIPVRQLTTLGWRTSQAAGASSTSL